MLLVFGGIVVRLAVLQVGDHGSLEAIGLDQRVRTVELPAARGQILDRRRHAARHHARRPRHLREPDAGDRSRGEAAQIADVLGGRVRSVLPALDADGTFAYVARQVDLDVAQRVEDLNLPGHRVPPGPKRYYPSGALAPQVLGFVGVDGQGSPVSRSSTTRRSRACRGSGRSSWPGGQPIAQGIDVVKEPVDGVDLHTTIDRQIQYQVQEALQAAVEANGAKAGTVIVMDPRTGDIYAMASYPWFDPNHFAHVRRTIRDACGTAPSPTPSSPGR